MEFPFWRELSSFPESSSCAFCQRTDTDFVRYGKIYESDGFVAHFFCMVSIPKRSLTFKFRLLRNLHALLIGFIIAQLFSSHIIMVENISFGVNAFTVADALKEVARGQQSVSRIVFCFLFF